MDRLADSLSMVKRAAQSQRSIDDPPNISSNDSVKAGGTTSPAPLATGLRSGKSFY